ncbi:MAG: polyprenyl synthetase family protein [Muribaculaceae bacterium]|nr:polyprenyl synthetase family protein [Muribaculaceae bacterium]
MKTIAEYSADVESALRKIEYPGGSIASLYEPISYALSAGGKRIRPVLTLMGAEAFGGDWQPAMKAALGIETFHNFTLLHDDVMDKSDMRRGRPTVHKKYDENTAILSGDTMLTLATKYVSEVPDAVLRSVLDTFNDMALRVYEGQRMDMDFEQAPNISLDSYLEMIEGKTGSLLGAAVKIGSIIGGANEKDASLMYEFGVMTGLAFQIQDDWLDTFGDSSTFGKPIGGDINNAKKTYLYVAAFAEGGQTAEALKSAYQIPAGDVRVKAVTRIYEKLGMSEKCKKAVGHYSAKALKALNATSLSEESKEAFRKLAEKLIGRKK